MRRFLLLPALLLTAALPGSGWADMTPDEREEFRGEVRAYLLDNPEILQEMIALLEERQADATAGEDVDRIAAARDRIFDDGYSFVGGNPDGDVTIVEFLDYQCGFCRRAHPEVQELVEGDGGIRWIVKEFPILGPGSDLAARAAVSTLITAGPESYAALNDRLMRLEGPISEPALDATLADVPGLDVEAVRAGMDDPEVTRRIAETRALAQDLGIQGTPSFVFEDRMLRGYAPLAGMQAMVEEIRAAN